MQPTPEAPADAATPARHDAMQAQGAGDFDFAQGRYRQVCGERVAFSRAWPLACDAIVAADTLRCSGAIEPFAAAAFDALRGGGLLGFTLEAHAGDGRTAFTLRECGRYSHCAGCAEAALQAAGFTGVERAAVVPRMEAQLQVNGWLVSAGRPC